MKCSLNNIGTFNSVYICFNCNHTRSQPPKVLANCYYNYPVSLLLPLQYHFLPPELRKKKKVEKDFVQLLMTNNSVFVS